MFGHLMSAYAAVFLMIGLINAFLVLRRRFSWFFLYELFSVVLLALGTAAYFIEPFYAALPKFWALLPMAAVLTECWSTVSGVEAKLSCDILPELKDRTDMELELAELVSLVFSAPAYLSCMFLFYDKFFK